MTAAVRASTETSPWLDTRADAVSNDTVALETPATFCRASVTCRTQFWHDMPEMCRTVSAMRRTLLLLLVVVAAGCSGGDTSSSQRQASESAGSAVHNEADVAFVQGMIPHHEQALQMADMVSRGKVSTELADLADAIRAAQQPEIDLMQAWLTEWGVAIDPHAGHKLVGHSDHGMMTDDDMAALGSASAGEFERMWLTMMIEHHEGAVVMAEEVITGGSDPRVRTLAEAVVAQQSEEISRMKALLAGR